MKNIIPRSIRELPLACAVSFQVGASGGVSKPTSVGTKTAIASCLAIGLAATSTAQAGTGGDVLLQDTYDSTIGVIQGYGAKLATGVAGAFAMIGSVFKFQPQLIASTLGVGFTGAGIDNAVDFTVTMTI
ncbi:hypothetical protein [Enterovibrio paralichthyis]|uniref:hypothetical protein n=1 Tax=Enterovibrio paralichthyis TaxID=2853805 RepID=UPI001C457ADF|nr:hypothetical protein [Enterovibrio paralichthyis]MBV7300265.1 hypothetical protein [Enterovibrio paralichthyis]